jgi:hypothetical protein
MGRLRRMRDLAGAAGPLFVSALALALSAALGALAETPGGAEDPTTPAAQRPAPSLDQLMKLPANVDYGMERRAGLTRGEWRGRFARVDASRAEEKRGLEAAQAELDRIAGSADQWLFGPPGTTSTDAPLDYRLRQEITRRKQEIERLERIRKDLEVEANLAAVPDEWRE